MRTLTVRCRHRGRDHARGCQRQKNIDRVGQSVSQRYDSLRGLPQGRDRGRHGELSRSCQNHPLSQAVTTERSPRRWRCRWKPLTKLTFAVFGHFRNSRPSFISTKNISGKLGAVRVLHRSLSSDYSKCVVPRRSAYQCGGDTKYHQSNRDQLLDRSLQRCPYLGGGRHGPSESSEMQRRSLIRPPTTCRREAIPVNTGGRDWQLTERMLPTRLDTSLRALFASPPDVAICPRNPVRRKGRLTPQAD